jgi:hypothetical protein
MYEDSGFDKDLFKNGIIERLPEEDYICIYENRLIAGGIKVDCFEDRHIGLDLQSS